MPKISIIIPTFNRINSLLVVLNKLENQKNFSEPFEVIIVDDGSTDNTQEVLKNFQTQKFTLKVLFQKNKKQWVARNFWVWNAQSDLILFLQDDIFPCENLAFEHFAFHYHNPEKNIVSIWKTTWTKEILNSKDKNFYKFLDWSWTNFSQKIFQKIFKAPLFNYEKLQNWEINFQENFFHFYTNNLSIKKNFFTENWWFNEKFNSYWWEDIEFWYRLHKKNMRLFFLKNAKAEHNHKYNLKNFLEREKKVAENLEKFLKIQPELKIIFNRKKLIKKIFFKIFCSKFFLQIFKILNKNFYRYFLGKKECLKN